MKEKLTQRWLFPPSWLSFLFIVLLILGIFFRFSNLDRKVYWHDEVFTSLRMSGYTWKEVKPKLWNGNLIKPEDIQAYQYPIPEKGFNDTLQAFIQEDPQHPPIYYMIVRIWVQLFGDSVAVIRSVSALISLLVFPAIYWLCLELFESSLIGWVAIALVAVSPIHVVFAQEARELSLWMVVTLLSSAALLRAIRLQTKVSWGIYAATLALGLYSFPLLGLTALGHGIYIVAAEHLHWKKTLTSYLLALVAGIFAFLPWIFVILNGLGKAKGTTEWSSVRVPLSRLVKSWAGNISRIFFDINLDASDPLIYSVPPTLIILGIVIYSFYSLYTSQKKAFLFLSTLVGVPALALILPDFILGGIRSTVPRYLIPCYLGILITVAYLIGRKILSVKGLDRNLGKALMVILLSAGVVSCAVSSQADTWWNKKESDTNPQLARIINQAQQPLVIGSDAGTSPGNLFSLSYLLDPKVRLELVTEPEIPKIPQGFSDVFVYDPSETLKSGIEREYNTSLERVDPSGVRLWKLKSQ